MKFILCFLLMIFFVSVSAFAQTDTLSSEANKQLMAQLAEKIDFYSGSSERACACVSKIKFGKKSRDETSKEIGKCLDKEVTSLQLMLQLMSVDTSKPNTITVNTNKQSAKYKETYNNLERYMLDSCQVLRTIAASENNTTKNSLSGNKRAMQYYEAGQQADREEDYIKAVYYYKSAVEQDKNFAFAWDNLGVNYRKLERYDEALEAYKSSLKIDPKGVTGLHNIPVVYEYQKKYDEALAAYAVLQQQYPKDPEGYYGSGRMYIAKEEMEAALINMCKAYNIYIESKSPYRADAESNIQYIFQQMKKAGKEERFNTILKENNIRVGK